MNKSLLMRYTVLPVVAALVVGFFAAYQLFVPNEAPLGESLRNLRAEITTPLLEKDRAGLDARVARFNAAMTVKISTDVKTYLAREKIGLQASPPAHTYGKSVAVHTLHYNTLTDFGVDLTNKSWQRQDIFRTTVYDLAKRICRDNDVACDLTFSNAKGDIHRFYLEIDWSTPYQTAEGTNFRYDEWRVALK